MLLALGLHVSHERPVSSISLLVQTAETRQLLLQGGQPALVQLGLLHLCVQSFSLHDIHRPCEAIQQAFALCRVLIIVDKIQ